MSERKKPPAWISEAEHKFTNEHGEVWYAKETEEGIILTGSDVDWEEYPIILKLHQTFRVPLMNELEKAWYINVLKVVDKKLEAKRRSIE